VPITTAATASTIAERESHGAVIGANIPVSVIEYGADPTGTNDSATALQAALTASLYVTIPAGTYKSSAALTLQSGQHIVCADNWNTILLFTGATNGFTFSGTSIQNVTIDDCGIQTSNAGGLKAINVYPGSFASHIVLNNAFIQTTGSGVWQHGIWTSWTENSSFNNPRCYMTGGVCIHEELNSNSNTINGIDSEGGTIGLEMSGSESGHLNGGVIEGASTAQISLNYSAISSRLSIIGTHIEGSGAGQNGIVLNGSTASISGAFFYGTFNSAISEDSGGSVTMTGSTADVNAATAVVSALGTSSSSDTSPVALIGNILIRNTNATAPAVIVAGGNAAVIEGNTITATGPAIQLGTATRVAGYPIISANELTGSYSINRVNDQSPWVHNNMLLAASGSEIVFGGVTNITGVKGFGNTTLAGGAYLLPTVVDGDLSGQIAAGHGGTGNAFFSVSGPASSIKAYVFPNANATMVQKIAGGTAALNQINLGTGATLAANTCSSAYVLSATGTLSTDVVSVTANANISSITGYGALTTDGLTIRWYPVADNVDWVVCNQTGVAIAISNSTYPSINYMVIR
jgi:hypothetical protein